MKHNFKHLNIWKLSIELADEIYVVTESFPKNEEFGLKSQIRRCTVSVASNIAEGSSRSSNKDFERFLQITLGSAYEIETQLLIAYDLKFIDNEELEILSQNLESIIKMTSKFKSTLNKSK